MTKVHISLDEKQQKPQVVHRTGNFYLIEGDLYLLANVDTNKVAMIRIGLDANRWTSPFEVSDTYNITAREMEYILGSEYVKLCEHVESVRVLITP